jgi:hypothetical protein
LYKARRIYRRGAEAYAKGRRNERRVGQALEALQGRGLISSYTMFAPDSDEDVNGIDAKMVTRNGEEILFQIKSSSRGVKKHLNRHPNIPCINVRGCGRISDVARLLLEEFML